MKSTKVEMVLNNKNYRLDWCSEKKQHLIVWMWFMSHRIVPVEMQIRCKGNRLTVLPDCEFKVHILVIYMNESDVPICRSNLP